jgi:transcriptional regulator with XRE-family HTH domain
MPVEHLAPDDDAEAGRTCRSPADLGAELRRRRKALGLSQQQMARRLGLSAHSSVTYYESGRRLPPTDIIDAYERHLDVPTGRLHRARLQVLASLAESDEVSPPRQDHMPCVHSDPVLETPQLGNHQLRRRLLQAVVVVLSVVATVGPSSAAYGVRRDHTWTQSTQNVKAKIEPATTPEPMDGDDPRARDCYADAVVVQAVPFGLPDGSPFGTLRLRHSETCGASWGSAYYSNPKLYTVRIVVHRPKDQAIVQDDWSNNTLPGSYSDMLSTGPGCVWVEVMVITPQGSSTPSQTGCSAK